MGARELHQPALLLLLEGVGPEAVGPAVFGDKSDKWWITGDLGRVRNVDNLWTGKRIADMACDTYYGLKTGGGRRSGVS